jgi:hypothetical protein
MEKLHPYGYGEIFPTGIDEECPEGGITSIYSQKSQAHILL